VPQLAEYAWAEAVDRRDPVCHGTTL